MEYNKKAKVRGVVDTKDGQITVEVFVILFEEDGCQIAYCPALNIYGYGKTEKEARNSFEISIAEFFDYTINKKTLLKELESLGWRIKKRNKFTAPAFSVLLKSNRDLKRIMDTKAFRKINAPIMLPTFA